MATLRLGNESVVETFKRDPGTNAVELRSRRDLGKRVTTMHLHETDIDDRPSRAMNLAAAVRFWAGESDKPPAWVESSDDELLAQLVADHFGCDVGQPKGWKEG